ncbi:MAG TPA: hypothetical protein P5234_15165 [Thermoanaerobaculaceae bacterium]|nr:hypothetical protein [Thermoanaerobaculaceae bacterium]HRS17574.1 hypothetical protein [Thermoanaerobaculaceae bacterium]
MARFVAALRDGTLLPAVSLQRFFPSPVDQDAGSLRFAGSAPGISAGLEVDVPTHTVVVVLTNLAPRARHRRPAGSPAGCAASGTDAIPSSSRHAEDRRVTPTPQA